MNDLSVSLDNVAGIQARRGQLDEALAAYTEALRWYAVLDGRFGPPFADPEEFAALKDAVVRIPTRQRPDSYRFRLTPPPRGSSCATFAPARAAPRVATGPRPVHEIDSA